MWLCVDVLMYIYAESERNISVTTFITSFPTPTPPPLCFCKALKAFQDRHFKITIIITIICWEWGKYPCHLANSSVMENFTSSGLSSCCQTCWEWGNIHVTQRTLQWSGILYSLVHLPVQWARGQFCSFTIQRWVYHFFHCTSWVYHFSLHTYILLRFFFSLAFGFSLSFRLLNNSTTTKLSREFRAISMKKIVKLM